LVLARNKILIFALKLMVSAASLFLIFRKADMAQVGRILKETGMPSFLSASAIYIASQFLSTLRWRGLILERFPVMKLFSLYMIGSFFSTFLPGLVGGDAVRAYYLNKDAGKISTTLASVFLDRYLGYVSLMTIGIAAFPFSLDTFGGSRYTWLMPSLFISFVVSSALFFGLQLGRRFRIMTEFYNYFSIIRERRGIIAKAFIISAVIQFMNFFIVLLLARRIGTEVSLLHLAVLLPIVITAASLPISISGIGVREGAFVLLLGLVGVTPEAATSLSLAWFFSVFMGSLPGLVFYMLHFRKQETEHA